MTGSAHLEFLGPPESGNAWRESARCRFSDSELFFPSGDSDAALEATRAARALCRMCKVRDECLQYAFVTKQVDGIWGGTTEEERRRLRRAWLADRRLRAG